MKFLTTIVVFMLTISTAFAQTYIRRVPGDIVQVTPGYVRQMNQCWYEQVQVPQQHYQNQPQQHSYTGTVVGGVAGALLGSRFGKGSGRTAATIAGAVGGAVVGDAIDNSGQPQYAPSPPQMHTRQVCAVRPVQMYNVVVRDTTGQSEVIVSTQHFFQPGMRVILVMYPNGDYAIE